MFKGKLSQILCLLVVLIVTLIAILPLRAAGGPFDALQERIAATGGYEFTAAVEQTLVPRPLPANVGKGAERMDSQVTGRVTLPDHAELTLRFEAGAGLPPITLEQEGSRSYLIKDGERTEIQNPLNGIAPAGDFASYLYAATNVQEAEGAHPRFTVYTFEIDGARYAEYVRGLMEEELAAAGQTDPQVAVSPLLARLTGHGELWVDANGLPRRQILDTYIPEISDLHDAQSHVVVDYTFPGYSDQSSAISDQRSVLSGQWSVISDQPPASSIQYPASSTQHPASSIQLPVSSIQLPASSIQYPASGFQYPVSSILILFTLLLLRRPRALRIPLSILLALISILAPPLRGTAYARQVEARTARPTLVEALDLVDASEGSVDVDSRPLSQTLDLPLQSTTDSACGTGSKTSDADLDGISDFAENCLGTDAYYFDSDYDQITDTVEIEGFVFDGQTWYSDPFNSDSNEDGLADYFEWPEPVGSAAEWDPDGDGIPNLWDEDNDGDDIPDNFDLDPFDATAYDASFSLQTTNGDSTFNGYQYIEFQVQPQDEDHLRYSTTALDWPYDEEGNVQDLDGSTEDLSLIPVLKITTNNAPSSDLQEEYGLSVLSSNGTHILYVILSPLSDGGKITAFEGQVVYGPGDLGDITWSEMELIWTVNAALDEQNGDDVDTETTPIAEYTEPAFRIAGLQITKSDETGYALLGTPNSPNDNRDLYQLLFGLDASFLSAVNPDLDEVVSRFSSDSTPIMETWGIPAADVAVGTPDTPPAHFDEVATAAASSARTLLEDHAYPTDDMTSLVLALETEMGATSFADLDGTGGSSFTFNLANVPLNTMRSVALTHYEYDDGGWVSMETEEVIEALTERYSDVSAILADLQVSYPDLTESDLALVLLGYTYQWTETGSSTIIATDGITLVDETADDQAIYTRYSLEAVTDLLSYLIEANDLALENGGLVLADRVSYYNYIRSMYNFNWGTVGSGLLNILTYLYYYSHTVMYGTSNTFKATALFYADRYGTKLGLKIAGASSLDDLVYLADDALATGARSLRTAVGSFLVKYAVRLGYLIKVLTHVLSVGFLAYEIYTIWQTRANYSSPYDYDEDFATAYAVTATIVAVVFFLISLHAFGLILLTALALASLITALIAWALGDEFDFMSEIIGVLAGFFGGSSDPYTQLLNFDFDGLDVDLDGSLVTGSTLETSDAFVGYIWRVDGSGNDQLNKSQSYGYFSADAGSDISVVTRRDDSRCTIGYYIDYDERLIYYNTQTCKNDLEADFTFNDAGIDQTLELLYKVKAETRYEYCKFAYAFCSMKTDHMTLPDELDSDDRWDAVEISIDVLPATLDELWSWKPVPPTIDGLADYIFNADYWNPDRDGDDLTNREEALLGTDPDLWDSDGDGLSDGFEMEVQEEAGTDPLNADSDGDGLDDGLEYRIGTTIDDADSDDDGLTDGEEVFHWEGGSPGTGAWTGGGWFVTIDGVDYWVFSTPLSASADNDNVEDASEKSTGSSPYAYNDAATLDLTAGPLFDSPSGAWSVAVTAGDTLTASLALVNSGAYPVTDTLSLCVPSVLTNVQLTTSGDRVPATQQNGSCYEWDFGSNNLLFLQSFYADLTATATAGTASGALDASVGYLIEGNFQPLSQTVPFVQDNTPPAVQLTTPLTGSILNESHYVLGGYSQDADSWVDHVLITVDGDTYTATGTSPWAYSWALPADGRITLSAIAYDIVGNASTVESVEVLVDTQPPAITSNLPDGATISAAEALSTSFLLSGTVTDNYAGLVRVQLRYNEQPWRTIWVTDSTPLATTWEGLWELPAVESAQGEHQLHMRAYDDYGNIGYLDQSVFVDILPPTNELTNRTYTGESPPHVPANEPLILYGVANDAGNNPLPADPAALEGTLHSITDATVWLQIDDLDDNDAGVSVAWLGDFNGDRLGDLAVGLPSANDGAGEIVIVRGAAGGWANPNMGELDFLADHRPSFRGREGAGIGASLAPAGDVNGDGFTDLLAGDPANDRVFLILGTSSDLGVNRVLEGDGGAKWAPLLLDEAGESFTPHFAPAGDVNNDGLSDIFVTTTGSGGDKVYLLLGDATLMDSIYVDRLAGALLDAGASTPVPAAVGDVDGDFIDDFAIALDGTVYLFAGGGGWQEADLSTLTTSQAIATFTTADGEPTIVALGDTNGDGVDDFAFSSGSSPTVVFGDAGQNFTTQSLGGFASAPTGFLAAAGDVDGDGQSDLLVGNAGGDAYLLLGGSFGTPAATLEGVATAASAPYADGADLAGDGSSDLLLVPSAAAAAALGYDSFGGTLNLSRVRPPYISSAALPRVAPTTVPRRGPQLFLAGGDVTVGTGPSADYSSIQAAIDSGADRVLIEPGVYYEAITLTTGVAVVGSGADRTYIAPPSGGTTTVLVDVDGVSDATLMNVSLVGSGSETGVRVQNGASNVSLSRTVVRDMGTAVSVDGAATDLEVKNLTVVGNGDGLTATSCAPVDVRNTLFAYNTGTALSYEGCAGLTRHEYNLYWANGADLSPLDPGGGELFANPLFEDYGSNDFRVDEDSPVIDAGAPGDPVPPGAGDKADIGHMEQTGSSYFAGRDYCSTCENDGLIWGVDAFDTIQGAVDAAQADLYALRSLTPVHFSVGVGSGTFTESVVISSSLYLLGSGAGETTIQGDGGPALTFRATAHASASDFTLVGGGTTPRGVEIGGGSYAISITRSLIKGNDVGILVTERSSGWGAFNTLTANTTGLETGKVSANITATTQYNWFDLENSIVSGNTNGLLANGLSAIFSNYNLLYNTTDYTNVVSGYEDLTGQDPLLTGDHAYLQASSPALDAAHPTADVPAGGGVRADIGWHELLAAPISILMGQADESIATESIGVAQVEYAIVPVAVPTSPVTSTLPTTWTLADLDAPGEKLSYWQTTLTPTTEGLYRIYSRATDTLGNSEADTDDWYDGAFVVDGGTPVVTLTLTSYPSVQNTWVLMEGEVYDYVDGLFDVEEIYFEIDGDRYDAAWSIQEWEEDGVSPRTFYYFFENLTYPAGTYDIQAFAVDGAGNVGASAVQSHYLYRRTPPYYDDGVPVVTVTQVTDDILDLPPFDELVGGTVTFEGVGDDTKGTSAFESDISYIHGYAVSFDGGASWDAAHAFDTFEGIKNGWDYTWEVPDGFDATTFPVRVRVLDNIGNESTTVVTVTIDTAPPRRFYPITYTMDSGYHFDKRHYITATWQEPVDGSGTAFSVVMGGNTGGTGKPWFEVDSPLWALEVSEGGEVYGHVGAEDAAGNVAYDVTGPWYAGSVQAREGWWSGAIQSLQTTIDGVLDIEHNEWLTPTELLDDDDRPETAQSLYATWDGSFSYVGWEGGWWGADGSLWVYYDVFTGGTNAPVTGSLSLPFDADFALGITGPDTGAIWTYTNTTWISETFDIWVWPQAASFAHDTELGGTEIEFMPIPHTGPLGTAGLDSNRLMAFTLDDAGDPWSAFPPINPLSGDFDYYYEWPIVNDGWDLLERPVSTSSPYVRLALGSDPVAQETLSTGDTVHYVATVENLEGESVDDVRLSITGSSGVSFQSVAGATCNDCSLSNSWLLDVPALEKDATHLVTVTAQLAADLSGLTHVTTTAHLETALPLPDTDASKMHVLDLEAPTVTIGRNPGGAIGTGTQRVSGTADDGLGAGVALVEVSTDGSIWQPATGTQSWRVDLAVAGATGDTWTLYARATDHHGQTGTVSVVLNTDTTAPVITSTLPSQIAGSSVALLAGTTRDPAPAGARVRRVEAQFDSATAAWQSAALYGAAADGVQEWLYTWSLPYADGVTHTVRFRATDYGGNVTTSEWQSTLVDIVAPTITVTQHRTRVPLAGGSTALEGQVTDGMGVERLSVLVYPESGAATETELALSGDRWSYELSGSLGEYRLYVQAEDTLGNVRRLGAYLVEIVDTTEIYLPLVMRGE